MAKSKYEYVKSFETDDEIKLPHIIIVLVDGCDFRRFSEVHEFEKPNDKKALDLMNECAKDVLEKHPDVIFSYGYSDEYSFIFKKETDFYERRASKMHSVVVSYFSAIYTSKWKEFFPMKELKYSPSFRSRVICCPTAEYLQAYLLWKRNECHLSNQYDTCYWELIKSGKSEKEAKEMLKVFLKKDKNELLFQQFNINYNDIPKAFRQGTCTLKTECKDDDGCPLKRPRRKIKMVHPKNIASKSFWSAQFVPMKELGQFNEDLNKVRPRLKYVTSFQYDSNLPLSNWIVIRIDGCHFHRFTEVHEFEKPNDAEALNLMNSCAAVVLEEFKDIVFAYGVSDEYSFVLKKDSQLYQRDASDIVSAIVSFFTSMYIKKWTKFFPHKELECLPYFDGRAVCYPSRKILLDYLAWRQVDCHINNQYNTCFWTLVKSGKSNSDAQNYLKGTKAQDKSDLVDQLSRIINYYSGLPPMFRLGSSVYWDKEKTKMVEDEEGIVGKSGKIVVRHCDIIKRGFWIAHPEILGAFKGKSMPTKDDVLDLRYAYPRCKCNMDAEIKIDVFSNEESKGRLYCYCKYDKCNFFCWLEPISVSWRINLGECGTRG
ncbi:hypothetical protein OROHE_006774 [Orobanche hederae]